MNLPVMAYDLHAFQARPLFLHNCAGQTLTLFRDAQMTLTVSAVEHKAGKSGDLILVDIDRIVMQDDRVRIKEQQTLVYSAAQQTVAVVPLPTMQEDAHSWTPTSVELLRFSAATFNAHRTPNADDIP